MKDYNEINESLDKVSNQLNNIFDNITQKLNQVVYNTTKGINGLGQEISQEIDKGLNGESQSIELISEKEVIDLDFNVTVQEEKQGIGGLGTLSLAQMERGLEPPSQEVIEDVIHKEDKIGICPNCGKNSLEITQLETEDGYIQEISYCKKCRYIGGQNATIELTDGLVKDLIKKELEVTSPTEVLLRDKNKEGILYNIEVEGQRIGNVFIEKDTRERIYNVNIYEVKFD